MAQGRGSSKVWVFVTTVAVFVALQAKDQSVEASYGLDYANPPCSADAVGYYDSTCSSNSHNFHAEDDLAPEQAPVGAPLGAPAGAPASDPVLDAGSYDTRFFRRKLDVISVALVPSPEPVEFPEDPSLGTPPTATPDAPPAPPAPPPPAAASPTATPVAPPPFAASPTATPGGPPPVATPGDTPWPVAAPSPTATPGSTSPPPSPVPPPAGAPDSGGQAPSAPVNQGRRSSVSTGVLVGVLVGGIGAGMLALALTAFTVMQYLRRRNPNAGHGTGAGQTGDKAPYVGPRVEEGYGDRRAYIASGSNPGEKQPAPKRTSAR